MDSLQVKSANSGLVTCTSLINSWLSAHLVCDFREPLSSVSGSYLAGIPASSWSEAVSRMGRKHRKHTARHSLYRQHELRNVLGLKEVELNTMTSPLPK